MSLILNVLYIMNKSRIKKYLTRALIALFFGGGMFFISYTISKHLTVEPSNVEMMTGDTITSQGKVLEFEYQKHKFINIVKVDNDGNKESFVVHDPNCKCTTKKLNNITTVITNTDNHNTASSDSIMRANFRVVLSKLNQLSTEVKTLRNEVSELKKMKVNPSWKVTKTSPKKTSSTNKKTNTKKK